MSSNKYMMKKNITIIIFIISTWYVLPILSQTIITLNEVKQAGLLIVEITTQNNEEPEGTIVESPLFPGSSPSCSCALSAYAGIAIRGSPDGNLGVSSIVTSPLSPVPVSSPSPPSPEDVWGCTSAGYVSPRRPQPRLAG